jgi:hypothetical protein
VFNPASLVPASLKRPDSHTYIYCVKEHCQWWVHDGAVAQTNEHHNCAIVVIAQNVGLS